MARDGSRGARWAGLVRLAIGTLRAKATRTAPRQTTFIIAGIAIPVALMVIVTSVSLGLASGATVASPDADYWIVPESDASSAVVEVGGPQFGQVHAVSERLSKREDVSLASPVALEVLRAEAGSTEEFVLAIGVIPGEQGFEISGVSTAALTPGDPQFANGTYNGSRTDEAVISTGASDLFGIESGDDLRLLTGTGPNRSVGVVAVDSAGPASGLPVIVLHLAELQTLIGTENGDRADQILVQTSNPAVKQELEGVYPNSIVLTRGGLNQQELADSELALAMALSALVVAVVIGVLFSATTIGLSVADRAPERAVLAAVGVSARSRAALVGIEALVLSLVGGVIGALLGLGALPIVEYAARELVADVAVTRFEPVLGGYGVGIGVLIGLLVLPYLWFIGRRTVALEVLYD